MALLITGISGFLGSHLAKLLQARELPYHGIYHLQQPAVQPAEQLDLFDREETLGRLRQLRPTAVFHLAAAANANWCELNPSESQFINVDAAINVATYCRDAGIPFVFTSTDLVFDGEDAPYGEEDAPYPICTYGMQKAAAEQGVQLVYPEAIIARLPLLYGYGANFLSEWAEKLKNGHPVHAFVDEFRTPAYVEDVAKGLLLLYEKEASGIYHLGGPESLSRYSLGLAIAHATGLDSQLLLPVRQEAINLPAPRPADVSLSSEWAYQLGYAPRTVEEALRNTPA